MLHLQARHSAYVTLQRAKDAMNVQSSKHKGEFLGMVTARADDSDTGEISYAERYTTAGLMT
jgi:hypothetical protein